MLERVDLKLEILKLAVGVHGRDEAEVIKLAKVYEGYVLGIESQDPQGSKAQETAQVSEAKAQDKSANKKAGNLKSIL